MEATKDARVLLVEDDEHVREAIRMHLDRSGYHVREAPNGLRALEALEQAAADVILCDIRMPRLDGVGVLKRVRAERSDLPVIMLTGFTDIEQAKSDRRKQRAASYAKRFAAKEACAKALGTGFRSGVFWRDLGVVNLPSGRPTMHLTGGAAERLAAITPAGHMAVIHLTITDEPPIAKAFVLIEAVPLPGATP